MINNLKELDDVYTLQKNSKVKLNLNDINYRIKLLNILSNLIQDNEEELMDDLCFDLGKSKQEAYMSEFAIVYQEIDYFIKNLKRISRDKFVKTPISLLPGYSKTISSAYGQVLILAPWNYPINLSIVPLIGSIAGGNRTILKLSAQSVRTSTKLASLINSNFDSGTIHAFVGSKAMDIAIMEKQFDFIFFTGSKKIAKLVYMKAALNLTPVALELGGKSPAIVHSDANIKKAAKHIAWGKTLNAGQTCVAPDYVLVHESIANELIAYINDYFKIFFGKEIISNPEYGKIINKQNYERLKNYLDDGEILCGGRYDDLNRRIEPTIITNISDDSKLLNEEIFGPILPIVTYKSINEVISFIEAKDHPLAFYLFSNNKSLINQVLHEQNFGGGCVNDCIMHIANKHLSFGGIGSSGIGRYHGIASYKCFTYEKSIYYKCNWFETNLKYPSVNKHYNKLALIKKIFK
ncbi:MAG: aldehyde dehydrogenase family protein [Erysipelotrichaceae bacterium]